MIWVAILFVFTLQNHRSHIHNQLKSDALELTSFRLTPDAFNKLQWKHNKEFKWNNAMYDVVQIQKVINGFVILAYEDNIETEIIRSCRKGIKMMFGNGENQEQQSQLVSLWLKSLFLPPQSPGLFPNCHNGEQSLLIASSNILSDNYIHKPFHPPCIPDLFC